MSVWREVQEALYQRFVTQWAATTPYQLDNEEFSPPEGRWIKVEAQRRPGGQGTLGREGNRKMDRQAVVFMRLREPPGEGVGGLSDLAEQAAAIFENCRLTTHDVYFGNVDIGPAAVVDDGRWWGVTIEAPLRYEHLK